MFSSYVKRKIVETVSFQLLNRFKKNLIKEIHISN